jgi:ribosomal protein S27AE
MNQSLIDQLESGSAQQRRAASYKMGKSEDPAYIPYLIKATNDQDAGVRMNVIEGLRRIGTDEAIEFLNADETERQGMVERYGGVPLEVLSSQVKGLLKDLRMGPRESRRKAAQELGQLTKSSETVILPLVVARETDRDSSVREAAAEALCAPVHQTILQERSDLDLDLSGGPVAVFRPLASIRWPQYCVGCLAPRPPLEIALGVSHATRASKGAAVGGLAGGLIGTFVGAAVAGDVTETPSYSVPVCKVCRSRLSRGDVSGLRGDKDAIVSVDIDTPLLSRQLSKGCVVLTFKNAAYAAVFRQLNEGSVFDSVETCRMGVRSVKIDPDHLESLEIGSESFQQSILDLLKSYIPLDGLFVEPEIPAKKLSNARQSCGLPSTKRILALVDCTTLGSAKDCLLFASEAIHYHNGWSSKTSGTGVISYREFASRVLTTGGLGELSLGQNQYLNVSGCSIPKEKLLGILMSVQRLLVQATPGENQKTVDTGSMSKGDNKCPKCGALIRGQDWTCTHCGHTQWGPIIMVMVVGGVCLATPFFTWAIQEPAAKWGCSGCSLLLGLTFAGVALSSIVTALRARVRVGESREEQVPATSSEVAQACVAEEDRRDE